MTATTTASPRLRLRLRLRRRRSAPPLFLAILLIGGGYVNSEWEYIEPMYACSPSISGCSSTKNECLANPNHPQMTTDAECAACQSGQMYWPCDVDGLCYCWDKTSPKIPPAPSTRTYGGGVGLNVSDVDPCDLLTEEKFKTLAPMAFRPYSYEGFCAAVHKYNENHPTEGVFNMGSAEQQRAELAAFLGNALHESDEFKAGREYLMCADRLEMGGEVYCRPCDSGSFDWDAMECPAGASLASEGRAFNGYCQSNLLPPEGCECDDVYERSGSGPMEGYVKANEVYFGRGSIQLSWNYNYIRASVALTGAPQTFCQRPDLVATNEEYAWGAGLFYWMENIKNDKTCHQSVLLNGDFGETLDNINGGLECPADDHGWHGKAVQLRLNRYCRAASAIGVKNLLSLDGCMDMDRKMKQCLSEGNCKDCKVWEERLKLDGAEATAADVAHGDGSAGDEVTCTKKNKEKCKQQQNNGGSASFVPMDCSTMPTKEEKVKCKQKNKQQQAAAAGNDAGTTTVDSNDKPETPSLGAVEKGDIEISTLPPTPLPSRPPTAQPTPADPTHAPDEPSAGLCTGEPCEVPEGADADVELCRSPQGICGAGPIYCNARSTWTSYCHDCDVDSPHGCPTFGCDRCSGETLKCVGNLNGKIPIEDDKCEPCGFGLGGVGQGHWPCDKAGSGGCWCWDTNLPRVEPSPPSGLEVAVAPSSFTGAGEGVCSDLLDRSTFNLLAPHAASPFTYQGFCQAVDSYNARHAEKVFRMGGRVQRLGELAAFLGLASHETNGFVAPREYLACGDNILVDGELYCKPCEGANYDYTTHTCAASMLENDRSYMDYCQPYTTPPNGCTCEHVKQAEPTGPLEGRTPANSIFFGRGSIQISQNFNYIRASSSMTGSEDTFCSEPELLAEVQSYAWGVGLYIWMEHVKEEGKTCHTHSLDGGFGGALDIVNGGAECPVDEDDIDGEWYAQAVISRLNHYCHAANILGVSHLLDLGGCRGLEDVFVNCLRDGSCPRCAYWDPNAVWTTPPTTRPTTSNLTTPNPTTSNPTTPRPTTPRPTTPRPTTPRPTTPRPTTPRPTTAMPIDATPPTVWPTSPWPTTSAVVVADTGNKESTSIGSTGTSSSTITHLTKPPTGFSTPAPSTQMPAKSSMASSFSSSGANQFAPTQNVPSNPSPSAHQFAVWSKPATTPTTINQPQHGSSPSASGFATMTHSKGRNGVHQASVARQQPDTPSPTTYSPTTPIPTTEFPTTASEADEASYASQLATMARPQSTYSPTTPIPTTEFPTTAGEAVTASYASHLGGMTNWANTKLEQQPSRPPVVTPVVDPVAMDEIPAPLPTKFPTKKPVNVINIADAYSPAFTNEVGMKEQPSIASETSSNEVMNDEPDGMLLQQQSSSYYTKLSETTYLFSPLDDVTISRSYPTTNFGSDPVVVVDMLEGDSTLLRFDLSAVGDREITKATLRLTPREDGDSAGDGGNVGSVFYVQPVVNGWTEDGVTYDTAPKASGALFASVARRGDDGVGGYMELSMTEAAANHVVSFKIVGTGRVRGSFYSKESSREEGAPALVVELEGLPPTSAVDLPEPEAGAEAAYTSKGSTQPLGTALHSKQESPGGKQKPADSKPSISSSANSSSAVSSTTVPKEVSSPPPSRSVTGRVWLDRNFDGENDSTEPGLRGILVDLYICEGGWAEGTRTAPGGDYVFDGLDEGRYYIVVTVAVDYGFSTRSASSEGSKRISGVDPSTGRSDCVELSLERPVASVNAGIVKLADMSQQISSSPGIAAVDGFATTLDSSESHVDVEDSPDHNCRGKPCAQEEGEAICRSKYNFCGAGDEYCNDDSRWIPDCGTPTPTLQPSTEPTTAAPTFVLDLDVNCAGDSCDEGDRTWCRSEIGYCGSGPLYCNSYSSWMPECDGDPGGSGVSESLTNSPTVAAPLTSTEDPTLETRGMPTLFPTLNEVAGFSPFALPTLSQVDIPKRTEVVAKDKVNDSKSISSSPMEAEEDGSGSGGDYKESSPPQEEDRWQTKENNNNEDTQWYLRFSDVKPVPRNSGYRPRVMLLGGIRTLSAISLFSCILL